MRRIDSRHNPLVGLFREAADARDQTGRRLLLDGAHLVREARVSGVAIEVVVVVSSRLAGETEEGRLARALAAEGVDVVEASEQAFAAMSPVRSPSGIAALVERPPSSADALFTTRDAFLVAAVDVQDPGNVGSLVRVAEAGGATGVLVCGASANPFAWKAVRGSMGSILRLPVVPGLEAADALARLHEAGIRPVAAVARGGAEPDAVDWRGKVAIVLGGEGAGLSEHLADQCHARVSIPMAEAVESLNVAAAAAVLVYAARRQRV
jgi:TrmH family RNA methyltransferase